MSWKPEVYVDGKWCGNALRFATRDEAEQNGADLLMCWFVPTDSRAVPSDDPVNYSYLNRKLEAAKIADHVDGYDRDDLGESPDY
jgi:hypothetical protein